MASYRETRNLLLLSHSNNIIDDNELLLLFDLNRSKNPVISYWLYPPIALEGISDDECTTEFRFLKNDIYRLAHVLHIPDEVICSNGLKLTGIEALFVYLKRFAYPCCYSNLVPRFAGDILQICLISNYLMNQIYNVHHILLEDLDQPWFKQNVDTTTVYKLQQHCYNDNGYPHYAFMVTLHIHFAWICRGL